MSRSIGSRVAWLLVAGLVACTPATVPPVASATEAATAAGTLGVLVLRSDDGRPLAGARVCATSAAGAERCAPSGGDGISTIQAPAGRYFVRVSGPADGRWIEATRVVELRRGESAIRVELAPLRRISGHVRDEAGAPVAEAEACAHPASEQPATCARSAADGAYAIDATAAVYRVEVTGPAGARLVPQWARGRVMLEEADVLDARVADVADVDVTLVRGVVLRGLVTLGGELVEDAQVCLRTLAAPLPWVCERSDKRGRYAALREPGSYYVWIVPPGNVRAVPQWYDGVLTGAESRALPLPEDRTLDVELGAGPRLSGVVRSRDGETVTGALVCIDTAFTTGRICRETDGAGRYAITTRPATYVVSVLPPRGSGLVAAYWDGKRTWRDADEIVLAGDRSLDLSVERGVPVSGAVRDPRGLPVAGATVNLLDGRSGAAASGDTDAAGRFVVAVVPGHYAVEVYPPLVSGLIERVLAVDVLGATDLNVTLDAAAAP